MSHLENMEYLSIIQYSLIIICHFFVNCNEKTIDNIVNAINKKYIKKVSFISSNGGTSISISPQSNKNNKQ